MTSSDLRQLADNPALLEVGRKAIEETLLSFRDHRISTIRGNGLVCREKDGKPSPVTRIGPEEVLRIGLKAIADHLEAGE